MLEQTIKILFLIGCNFKILVNNKVFKRFWSVTAANQNKSSFLKSTFKYSTSKIVANLNNFWYCCSVDVVSNNANTDCIAIAVDEPEK